MTVGAFKKERLSQGQKLGVVVHSRFLQKWMDSCVDLASGKTTYRMA